MAGCDSDRVIAIRGAGHGRGSKRKNLVAYRRTTKSSAFLGADRNSLYEDWFHSLPVSIGFGRKCYRTTKTSGQQASLQNLSPSHPNVTRVKAHECRAAPQASFIPHHSSAFFIELHPAQSIRQVAWSLGMVAFA